MTTIIIIVTTDNIVPIAFQTWAENEKRASIKGMDPSFQACVKEVKETFMMTGLAILSLELIIMAAGAAVAVVIVQNEEGRQVEQLQLQRRTWMPLKQESIER